MTRFYHSVHRSTQENNKVTKVSNGDQHREFRERDGISITTKNFHNMQRRELALAVLSAAPGIQSQKYRLLWKGQSKILET